VAAYKVPRRVLDDTFTHFRSCGRGRRECQVLWVSPWDAPETITTVVHPEHEAHGGGFVLDNHWLNDFWLDLARESSGIRVQVHTHPGDAFHSPIDDAYPIIHTAGFLSLVIPNFGLGPEGLDRAYLTEIQENGGWQQAVIAKRLIVV